MSKTIKKIAILTSGGDAPGMNASVRSIAKMALASGLEAYLVYYGYKGLHEGNIVKINDSIELDKNLSNGGTFIYSARFPEFKDPQVRLEAKGQLDKLGIDALVVIGGDGSYMGAELLHDIGVRTIGLPGTIDNDIASSDITIGFDTALNTIVDAVDKIRDTAKSHTRAIIVEVMGRYAGDLALWSGIATGAEIIVTSENKKNADDFAKEIDRLINVEKKESVIAIVTEHIYDDVNQLAKEIEQKTNVSTRASVLGHMQRGGKPTAFERALATRMGIKAVELLLENKSGLAIGTKGLTLVSYPIKSALKMDRSSLLEELSIIEKLNK